MTCNYFSTQLDPGLASSRWLLYSFDWFDFFFKKKIKMLDLRKSLLDCFSVYKLWYHTWNMNFRTILLLGEPVFTSSLPWWNFQRSFKCCFFDVHLVVTSWSSLPYLFFFEFLCECFTLQRFLSSGHFLHFLHWLSFLSFRSSLIVSDSV